MQIAMEIMEGDRTLRIRTQWTLTTCRTLNLTSRKGSQRRAIVQDRDLHGQATNNVRLAHGAG